MGVKGLTGLLQRLAPDAVRTRHISHYKGKTLAIDVSCFLNRFIYGLDPHPARVQRGVYRLCLYLHMHEIRPIFVFDGEGRIVEKEQEGIRREAMKQKVKKSFKLEKIRKTRLKGLKGSAQILRDFSPEQVVSIMEDIRIRENGGGGGGDGDGSTTLKVPVAGVSATFDADDKVDGQGDEELGTAAVVSSGTSNAGATITTEKTSTAISTGAKESSPQQELHLAKIYELLGESIWAEEEPTWTIPTLPDEFYRRLEEEHAKLLAHSDDHLTSTEGLDYQRLMDSLEGNGGGALEDFDAFERELDTLDRLELDVDSIGGVDVIYDLSDQVTTSYGSEFLPPAYDTSTSPLLPLVLRTGTSMESIVSPSDLTSPGPEEDTVVIRKRVHAALEEFVQSVNRPSEDAEREDLAVNATRKQRALDALELKLAQEIKEYTGINAGESQVQVEPIEAVEEGGTASAAEAQPISSALSTPLEVDQPTPNGTHTASTASASEELVDNMAIASMNAEPVWTVKSDPSDTAATNETDPIPTENNGESVTETIETSSGEETDQDLKSMIHDVLSAHQTLFMTLERRTFKVTRPLVLACQKLLVAMGEPVVEAIDAEAEAVCARLTTLGLADASVSEDTDTVVFGNGLLLRQVGSTGDKGIIEIDPVVARERLGLNRDAFRDLCILCGTDFSGTIEGVGPIGAVKLMQYYGSIESIMVNTNFKARPDFVYDRARRVFDRTPVVPLDLTVYQSKPEIQPLLLELLLKYDINPEEFKQEILSEIKTEETITGFDQPVGPLTPGAESSVTFGGSSLGADPFKATAIGISSLAKGERNPTF
ncbi:Elongation of fatty acids protein 2 [Mortierella sp. GBA35]|nr:Elongation of fatty acids protein 2 [Mortierella sp. GBA35]